MQRLLRVRLRGVDEEQPPARGQVSLGHLQQPVGAEHAGDEASVRYLCQSFISAFSSGARGAHTCDFVVSFF